MDDDEHEKILTTPIIEGKVLKAAIAGMEHAQKGDDPDKAHDALAKVAAIVRTMLENTADLYGMLAAGFDMAQNASPELQRVVAAYAKARLELLASHH
jgi:hypothetical protein